MTITDEELEKLAKEKVQAELGGGACVDLYKPSHRSCMATGYIAGYRACEARSALEIAKLKARVKELEKSLEWYKKPEGERNRIQRMNRQ